ncbi:hypothetical protein PUNSTDRAFT_122519 [Punctularia strigosozonata HHB-11173 SS5]|uniref:Uncharacterized protein n=1 Tax=Punctularia strigosozonata (strain HHB-11173) TaxID=741275 RepID=R7S5G7_PUNST|nr:uncharacterized protein PUNSTDRAFT_122519 [Punctularia strigosozonata HHB-11173 SS5]EIN05224.1 hypothetical protein PUNSTDRAFT_122519 [Punctularia strigosozonata HHB-11173 SS5]
MGWKNDSGIGIKYAFSVQVPNGSASTSVTSTRGSARPYDDQLNVRRLLLLRPVSGAPRRRHLHHASRRHVQDVLGVLHS